MNYEIVKNSTKEKVLQFGETVAEIAGASASQATIEKVLSLRGMQPGMCALKMKLADTSRNRRYPPASVLRWIRPWLDRRCSNLITGGLRNTTGTNLTSESAGSSQ